MAKTAPRLKACKARYPFTAAVVRTLMCQILTTEPGPAHGDAWTALKARLEGRTVKIGAGRVRGVVEYVTSTGSRGGAVARILDRRGVSHLEPVEAITEVKPVRRKR